MSGRRRHGAALAALALCLGACATSGESPATTSVTGEPGAPVNRDAGEGSPGLVPLEPAPGAAATGSPPARSSAYPKPAARRSAESTFRAPARHAAGTGRLFVDTPRDAATDGPMRIHFIDVGQGAATLFEFPCGAILADTGGESIGDFSSSERLAVYLEAVFARRADLNRTLDLLIVTHQHIDHTRGAERIREDFTLRRVADNGQSAQASGSAQQNALRQWAEDNGVEYLPIRAGEIEPVAATGDDMGSADLSPLRPVAPCAASPLVPAVTFLWGDSGTTQGAFSNPNNNSVTFRVDWGESSALIIGDLQLEGIGRLIAKYGGSTDLLDADVFEAGHHGSHNATTEALTGLISPKMAIFAAGDPARQAGQFNAFNFGHPNHKAVRILDDPWQGVACGRSPVDVPVGIKGRFRDSPPVWEEWTVESALFSTGWDGDIVVEALSDGALAVSTQNQQNSTGFNCP